MIIAKVTMVMVMKLMVIVKMMVATTKMMMIMMMMVKAMYIRVVATTVARVREVTTTRVLVVVATTTMVVTMIEVRVGSERAREKSTITISSCCLLTKLYLSRKNSFNQYDRKDNRIRKSYLVSTPNNGN